MVEFSWNSRSTSMSKLHVVMHQVIPPTTWGGGTRRQEEGERCDKLVFVYFVKLPEPEIELNSRSQFSKTWPVLPRLWILCYLIKRRQSFDSCSEVSSSQQQLQDLCQLNALLFILSGLHLGIKHTIITMIICRKLVWAYGLLKCCRARHCCRNAAL